MQNEICLRLTTLDLVNPQLITHYINHLGIPLSNIDIIIDLRDELTEDKINSGELYTLAMGLINNLAHLNEYRKVILSGVHFLQISVIFLLVYILNLESSGFYGRV